jgi:16S rRNA (cytosine1402-N4)-methyltransferase
MSGDRDHHPVMLAEVVQALRPRAGALYVDATFGAGGYAAALLDAAVCRVVGIDRDRATLAAAKSLIQSAADRLTLVHGRFGDMVPLLAAIGIDGVDGIAFDLGVSSMQLDLAERGFSFRFDGPLDMRMDSSAGATAADMINALDEADLARVLAGYGEERAARRVARAIVRERERAPIVRTAQLADIVRAVVRPAADGRDPATRTFQALRILVNDELGELDRGLVAAERLLLPGGRLSVVAFHSLEDRRVKTFLRARSGNLPRPSRHSPGIGAEPPRPPSFRLLSLRAQLPSAAEVTGNPRARSARLRAAERTDAPAWGDAHDGQKRRAA